jgi:uncharacterized protein YjbI with pentapeptide repeats
VPSVFQRLFTDEKVEEQQSTAAGQIAVLAADPAIEPESVSAVPTTDFSTSASDRAVGLIPAEKLPSAANTLAELFPEEHSEEQAQREAARSARTVELSIPKKAPKKRGVFGWFFGPNQRAVAVAEEPTVSEPSAIEPNVAEPEAGVDARIAEVLSAPVAERADADVLGNAAETRVAATFAARDEISISADDLPPAAQVLEELFARDPIEAERTAENLTEIAGAADDGDVAVAAEEMSVENRELLRQIAEETVVEDSGVAIGAEEPGIVLAETTAATEPPSFSASDDMDRLQTAPVEAAPVEIESSELADGDDAVDRGETAEAEHDYAIKVAENFAAREEESAEKLVDSATAESLRAENTPEAAAAAAALPHKAYRDWAFDDKLASHREWAESHGLNGKRADLSGAELEGEDLISVNLRLADLHDANLRGADMLLADLRDACMVRADLEESCLVGANLEGANLEGASLETAMGLVPRQFAGANLRDALLAPQLMEFEAATPFARNAAHAYRYFITTTAVSLFSWLLIWKTRDVQLVTDSAIIPFLHSRAAAAALPTAESYLIVPVALFVLYIVFHFHLQRLWDSVQELPAIFPDGHTLGDGEPGIIVGLLRTHFRWMNPDPPSTRFVERLASRLLAYWMVPLTLLFFWARYLTRQEIHGTILQALLTTIATGIAVYATTKVGRPQERWAVERKWTHRFMMRLKAISPVSVAVVFGLLLLMISAGTIAGIPHDRARAPQYNAASVRRWAPSIFWWLGFDPYADVTEASISTRPSNWNGEDEQVAYVDGARINNLKLRYAQAYGVFLANAHLWHADFQGAFLSEADLRSADLGQSNLRFAVMDQARMNHANLDRSNLDGADLRRADLRGANLSYTSLANTMLVDARLDGASFYTAHLDGATLTRANLEKADLRDSYLVGAHMDHADLQGAYLWSARLPGADLGGAQLGNAILIDADLHGANLGGAKLSGTVLNNTNLSGTSLEGADLRGALGLTANQLCSAKSRAGVMLDDALATQVLAQCGTGNQ